MKSPLFDIVLFSSGLASALVAPGCVVTSSAQETSKPVVAWAKQHAIHITTVESGHGFADLQALKTTIGQARIVALGESAHQIHEFRAFRNRLLEFLVLEKGFTAIAAETGFSEGVEVDDYVTGRTVKSGNLAQRVFMWSPPQEDTENLELIEWMRRYNAQPSTARKIRFYGIDHTGGGQDDKLTESRRALDAALSYVERVDGDAGKEFRGRLEPFLAKFSEDGYSTLAPAERNTLTATIADLVNLFDRRRIDFLAVTSERDYQNGYRHAVTARQIDAHFRLQARDTEQNDFRDEDMARDATMADSVRWVLEREGPEGRILVFAHNIHVVKGTILKEPYPEYFPGKPPTRMGQYLRSMLGDDMVVLGFTFQRGEKALKFGTVDPTSVDGILADVGLPLFALDLRAAPKAGPVADWLHQGKKIRDNDRYAELVPIVAFDALLFIESISAVHPIH